MLSAQLSFMVDVFGRCEAARALDVAAVTTHVTSASRGALIAVERTRRERERALLAAASTVAAIADAAGVERERRKLPSMLYDILIDAMVAAYGLGSSVVEGNPFRTDNDNGWVAATFAPAAPWQPPTGTKGEKGAWNRLATVVPCEGEAAAMRRLLYSATSHWRVLIVLAVRRGAIEGPSSDAAEECVRAMRDRLNSEWAAFDKVIGSNEGIDAPANAVVPTRPVRPSTPPPREVLREVPRVISPKEHPLVERYRREQPMFEAYVALIVSIQRDEIQCEDYYANEGHQFEAQFAEYAKRVTHHLLHETPLDADWVARKATPTAPLSFVNVRTGKCQTEHPNSLKVAATLQRQMMKANKEREQRQHEMLEFVERLNDAKAEAARLERALLTGAS